MGVKLYGVAGSPNVRGAMLGFLEKGVAYEMIDVPPPFKDPAHMARNPFGRVPVLDHDGFVLYETQAILRYADRAFSGPSLQPADLREAARMDQILSIVDCYLFKTWSGEIGFERLVAQNFLGRPPNLEAIEAALPLAQACADALEALAAKPYLTGETFSLADIRLLPHFAWFQLTPEGAEMLKGKPKLIDWFRRASERPSVAALNRT